jgi:hypothetical protein
MATSRKRNIEIEFVVDDKQAAKNLQNLDKNVTKTGQAFSNAGKLIASGLVLDKVVDFARAAINAYSDLNESLNAVDVTFGGAAQGIKELGEDAAESLGLSNAEFNSLAVGFSAFAETIASSSGQTIVPVMDELTTRIADFASVMNLDVADAAVVFRSGLAGETEPLRKFGIDVSAAAVNQKALALGLADSTSELTEQDKILARYNLIMEQTEKTAGDFANTSDDLANSLRISGARFTDFTARLGEELVPIAEQATTAGMNLLDAFDGDVNLGWTQRLSAGLQTILAESPETVAAYIEQKAALNDLADAADEVVYPSPTEEQIELASQADEVHRRNAEAYGLIAEAADNASTAQQEFTNQQREQLDPAFKLIRAQEKATAAYDKYNQIILEGKAGSDEAEEAALDLAIALLDLDAAGADLAATDGGIQTSVSVLEELLERGDVLPGTIQAIIDKILEYNATPIGRKDVFVPGVGTVTTGGAGSVGGDDGTMIGFAEGGVVPGPKGAPMLATVHGGEEVLTPEQRSGGASTVITLNALTLSDRQLKEIQEMGRRK